MQMRQKDMQIQNLQRHLEVMKSELLKADATKDKIIVTAIIFEQLICEGFWEKFLRVYSLVLRKSCDIL